MANQIIIYQETKIIKHSKEELKVITVSDDYGTVSICLDIFQTNFFENPIALFKSLLDLYNDKYLYSYEKLNNMFDYMFFDKKGVNIEGKWYDWEEIQIEIKNTFGIEI